MRSNFCLNNLVWERGVGIVLMRPYILEKGPPVTQVTLGTAGPVPADSQL